MITVGKSLENNEVFKIDFEKIISERTFICSMTRYGKSYTVRKICEEIFGKVGIIIFDPEGEYISLREKYPFLIIGKDIPLNPDTAGFLAEQVLKEDLSVIIDSSTVDTLDEQEFATNFINKFMDLELKQRKSYLFIIEESDEFAPEKGVYKSGSLRSVINLAKKGAKRGIGLILASQRPAMISKFVLSQCANQIIGHTEWSGDLKVLQQYLRIEKEVIEKIPKLKAGEFYFQGNFIDKPVFAKVNPVITTHLGGTPSLQIPQKPKEIKEIVDRLSKSLPKIIEEKLKPSILDKKEIEEQLKPKIEKEFKRQIDVLNTEIKTLEKSKVSDEEVKSIIDERVEKEVDEYKGKFQEQDVKIRDYKKFISSLVSKGKLLMGEEIKEGESYKEDFRPSSPIIETDYDLWLEKFSGGKKKVLELLIKHGILTRSQLTIMSGLKKLNINHNILPILKSTGLIKYDSERIELVGG